MTLSAKNVDRFLAQAAFFSFLGAWLGAIFLFLFHLYHEFSFRLPVLTLTSGGEEQDLFAVWKITQGLPVYSNPHDIPFTVSTYNWGFYFLYGSLAKLILAWVHLDSAWLPTVCRLITLSLSATCCGLFFLILRQSERAWRFWPPLLLFLLCLGPLCGPLAGKWVMTTRPDMGGLMFELAGLVFALRYLQNKRWVEVLFAGLSFYAAWSFKQSSLSALAGTGASFLILGEWRALLLLSGVWLSLVFGTFSLGGDLFFDNVINNQRQMPFAVAQEVKYFFLSIGRDPYLVLMLIALLYWAWNTRLKLTRQPIELTLFLASAAAFLWVLVTLGKIGSDTNYFIPFATWSLLWFLVLADRLPARFLYSGLIFFSWALIFKLIYIFSTGIAIPPSLREPYADLSSKLEPLPAPILVTDQTGDLPWIQSKPPYFVINSDYDSELKAGIKEAHGGWEGLLRDGYFNTVVTSPLFPISPDLLAKYTLISSDANFQYYTRKP